MKTTLNVYRILFFLIFSSFFLNTSCSKDSEDFSESNQNFFSGDGLSEEDNLYLESISVPTPELNEIDVLSGKKTADQLELIIQGMVKEAQEISYRKSIKHSAEIGTGKIIKPEHYGVAYSYGQDNFDERFPAPQGSSMHKKYSVFGTDCSGFVIYLLKRQKILIARTDVKGFEDALKNAIENNPTFKGLIVENKGRLSENQVKSGDFIVWNGIDPYDKKDKAHMGMIVKHGGKADVFNSHGNPFTTEVGDQEKNYGLKRGVHTVSLNDAINNATKPKNQYWGINYKIIRISGVKESCDTSTLTVTTTATANSATATATGGQPPYKYLWSNSAIGSTVNNLPNGNYIVNVTDAAGCIASATVIIAPALIGYYLGSYTGGYTWIPPAGGNPPNSPLSLSLSNVNGIVSGSMTANNAVTYALSGTLTSTTLFLTNIPWQIEVKGTLSSDGRSITGTWAYLQPGNNLPPSIANFQVSN